MKILLVDNNTKNINELKKLLENYDFFVCRKAEFSEEMANSFDLIVFSGGSKIRSVKDHKNDYIEEINFIKNFDKKIIGICLGSEIIAVAFGSTIKEMNNEKHGISEIKFNNENLQIYESHRFAIDEISDELEILAISEHGIEMFKHKTRPIYGLQFHPEMFVDITKGRDIFIDIISNI